MHQEVVYNGYKRVHALKYQAAVSMNGLVAHLVGPVIGARHDNRIFQESNLAAEIHRKCTASGRQLYAYGDQGYAVDPYVVSPFRRARNALEIGINSAMVPVRLPVEWTFGKISQLFAFVDFSKNQRVGLQPVGVIYRVAVLLTNAHSCLYGSGTSTFFDVQPPTIEEYFSN